MDRVYEIAEEGYDISPTGMVVETYSEPEFISIIFTYKNDRAQICVVDKTVMFTVYTSTIDKLGWKVWKEEHCSYDISLDICRTLMLYWIRYLN